jgi:hypothetical protein
MIDKKRLTDIQATLEQSDFEDIKEKLKALLL